MGGSCDLRRRLLVFGESDQKIQVGVDSVVVVDFPKSLVNGFPAEFPFLRNAFAVVALQERMKDRPDVVVTRAAWDELFLWCVWFTGVGRLLRVERNFSYLGMRFFWPAVTKKYISGDRPIIFGILETPHFVAPQ